MESVQHWKLHKKFDTGCDFCSYSISCKAWLEPLKSLILSVAMNQSHITLAGAPKDPFLVYIFYSLIAAQPRQWAVATVSSASKNHHILELERTAFQFSFYPMHTFSLLPVQLYSLHTAKQQHNEGQCKLHRFAYLLYQFCNRWQEESYSSKSSVLEMTVWQH